MFLHNTDLNKNLLTNETGPNEENFSPPNPSVQYSPPSSTVARSEFSLYDESWKILPKHLQDKQSKQEEQQTQANNPADGICMGTISAMFFVMLSIPSFQGDVSGLVITLGQIATGGTATYQYLKAIYQCRQNEVVPSETEEKKSDVEAQRHFSALESKSDNDDDAHRRSSHQESISSDDEESRSCFGFSSC